MRIRITAGLAFAGITAAMVALFAPTATATSARSICETGFRGQPAYDRECLSTGVVGEAGALWYGFPKGVKGKERDDSATRRGVCKYAHRHGGIKRAAVELVTDLTYDSYRNHKQVDRWVISMAVIDCHVMGYKV